MSHFNIFQFGQIGILNLKFIKCLNFSDFARDFGKNFKFWAFFRFFLVGLVVGLGFAFFNWIHREILSIKQNVSCILEKRVSSLNSSGATETYDTI
jgi:hypothetical protein